MTPANHHENEGYPEFRPARAKKRSASSNVVVEESGVSSRLLPMAEVFGFDCYAPKEIAERVENVGVTKANLPRASQFALGVLAGGFIGLGAMCFTLVVSDAGLSFAVARTLGGLAFSLGLILVVVAGAELFTLDAVNWFGLGRNLLPVTLGNLFGGAGMVGLVYWIIYRRPAVRPAKGVPAP